MDDILLFNTPSIEGYTIEEYYGFVSANQVAGTGFLTDFTASVSDFFGGNSAAYRDVMNKLLDDVSESLKRQTRGRGGNAIIGVRVDFDNISAKNMSMFMVSMQGTAVKIKPAKRIRFERFDTYQKLYDLSLYRDKGIITDEQYEAERKNLLFTFEEDIDKEIEAIKKENSDVEATQILRQKALEERNRIEFEKQRAIEESKAIAATIIDDVRSLLENNISDPSDTLNTLDYYDVLWCTYDDVGFAPNDNVAHNIGLLLKEDRVAHACKYYIDLVNTDDMNEVKEYIMSVYNSLTLKNPTAFENKIKELLALKESGKSDLAVEKFEEFALCDTEIAEQVIEML